MGYMKDMFSDAHREAVALRDTTSHDRWQLIQLSCMIWILSRGMRMCDHNARMMATIRNKYKQSRGR